MSTQVKVTFPNEFKAQSLEQLACSLGMYIVYIGNQEYEFVPIGETSEILEARKAEQRKIKERLAIKATQKTEPLKVSNVYPLPIKPRKTSIFRVFRKPLFDGPGAA